MLEVNFNPFPNLSTDRLLLTKMTFANAPDVLQLRSDATVMQYINRPLLQNIEEAEAWIKLVLDALENNSGITWGISLKDEPSLQIGNIGLWRIEKENHRAELGYMLLPAYQSKGFITEALRAVVQFGFEGMKLHSMEARIDPRNHASAAVLKKLDFIQEAYFKENYWVRGSFADTAVYSLLASNYRAANNAAKAPKALAGNA